MKNTLTDTTSNNIINAVMQNASEQISEVATSLNETSKEKYNKKISLIENASDMTTKEKLDAMDHCYECITHEAWQNVLLYVGVSVTIIGFAIGSPVAIKSFKNSLLETQKNHS